MTLRHSLTKYAAVSALAAGMAFAQASAVSNSPTNAPKAQEGRCGFMRQHLEHLAQTLNLTDSQKQQARTIFQQARQSAQPVRQELKQNREALSAAAKAGQTADIQKLSSEQGRLMGRLVAIRTEASAKFYQILTPEQRAKADQMHQQFRQRNRNAERKNG